MENESGLADKIQAEIEGEVTIVNTGKMLKAAEKALISVADRVAAGNASARELLDASQAIVTIYEITEPPSTPLSDAVKTLADNLRDDEDLRCSWESNIAMAMVDEGGDIAIARRGAARFIDVLVRHIAGDSTQENR